VKPPELETSAITHEDGIAIVTLARPEHANTLDMQMVEELPVACSWLADRAPVRAVVLTGAGRIFCGGGDIGWMRAGLDQDDLHLPSVFMRGAEIFHQGVVDLCRIPHPVIAAINGPVAGGGLSLALACDVRIAAPEATFTIAYGRIGVTPDGGLSYFLPRVVGPARALDLLLDDRSLDADEALRFGLITEIASDSTVLAAARAKAERMIGLAPGYLRAVKVLVAESLENQLSAHLQRERMAIGASAATDDFREGVTAFFERRSAAFVGR
jgi:2-(1,2-epoxy-1,2-dihydrophenyl)acetyl-CoA isomerase